MHLHPRILDFYVRGHTINATYTVRTTTQASWDATAAVAAVVAAAVRAAVSAAVVATATASHRDSPYPTNCSKAHTRTKLCWRYWVEFKDPWVYVYVRCRKYHNISYTQGNIHPRTRQKNNSVAPTPSPATCPTLPHC